jgi:transposase
MKENKQNGIDRIEVFLDGNPTHKGKMRTMLEETTKELGIKINFHLIASYSPKLNLVEYVIHLIRQKVLHHADATKDLAQFEQEIKQLCQDKKILDKQQIINILTHIENLIPKT